MTDHWTHLETDVATRSVCQCGWVSPWHGLPADAVEDGLAHTAKADDALS
jgi:hypothetical protein